MNNTPGTPVENQKDVSNEKEVN